MLPSFAARLRSCPDTAIPRKGDAYEFHSPPVRNRDRLKTFPFYPGPRTTWRRSLQGPRTIFIYLAVVFGLLVIPRALQRFRLPAPLTCFAFGIIVAGFFKPLIQDSVISYLDPGYRGAFSFAGLEVDFVELRRQIPSLTATSPSVGWCWWRRSPRGHLSPPWLAGRLPRSRLPLLTPSTGFIRICCPTPGSTTWSSPKSLLHAVAGEVTAVSLFR